MELLMFIGVLIDFYTEFHKLKSDNVLEEGCSW